MIAVLLDQDYRQQVGAGPAARDDGNGAGASQIPLTIPAGELLAHGLPHGRAPRLRGTAPGTVG